MTETTVLPHGTIVLHSSRPGVRWVIFQTREARAIAERMYRRQGMTYTNTWKDVAGYGLHAATPVPFRPSASPSFAAAVTR